MTRLSNVGFRLGFGSVLPAELLRIVVAIEESLQGGIANAQFSGGLSPRNISIGKSF
ncbi:MAG: hypothetical protein GY845_15275 [Planctomycetes bacterium]|nr:hypothetical protein [Planctomycetota bacterium]